MKPSYITDEALSHFITQALEEDVGEGDHSSLAAIPADRQSRARLIAKDQGIIAGVDAAVKIFEHVDRKLNLDVRLADGKQIRSGDIVLTVHGSARSILTAERLVLNTMQRMSGIATSTRRFVELVRGTNAKILDTRKTTPNFRLFEKWAVLIGGGYNHRLGLYDMVMLKDNHIDFAGGIRRAIEDTNQYLRSLRKHLKIEIETRSLEEVAEVLATGNVDVIMLDNMTPAMMKEAVTMINGRFTTEASGGINESTIRAVAETGVDFISVGALTHSYKSLDLSLKAF